MKRITLDQIASVTHRLSLQSKALISQEIKAQPGTVIAVRVLSRNDRYDRLEIVGGRMPRLYPGDVIAGVLGNRKALHGHAGKVPDQVQVGDRLHLLNLGGVIGKCHSSNSSLGNPIEVEVLGSILHFPIFDSRQGVEAHLSMNALPLPDQLSSTPPIIFISGTCMNSGKTLVACEVTRALTQKGFSVAVGKLTGVALQRDVLAMIDCGAHTCLSFADAGFPSTDAQTAPLAARAVLSALTQQSTPSDFLVIELGDGLAGEYGVMEIFQAPDIQKQSCIHVMCAIDPVGAYGASHLFETKLGRLPDLYSGPVTDNQVGVDFINQRLKKPAFNAKQNASALHDSILDLIQPFV